MQQSSPLVSNPFALLLNPEAVHAALQGSVRLNGLKSRVWRPLDQPLIPRAAGSEVAEVAEVAEYDLAVDATQEPDESPV